MLLAYTHCFGPQSEKPELCVIADKPDQSSYPVRIDSLIETKAAVCRVGPIEAITVKIDPADGGKIITPLGAVSLYITPNLNDRPGISVKCAKVVSPSPGVYETYYIMDKGKDTDMKAWSRWEPNKMII